jgi:outer membrane protein OmpA-like peptidoglycan-associated protein
MATRQSRSRYDSGCRELLAAWLAFSPAARANVNGSDTQNFNPLGGSTTFVTVHSAATLRPGRFGLGLFLNEAMNTIPYQKQGDVRQSRSKINDSLVGADLTIGVGLMPRLELQLAAPFVVSQRVGADDTRGEFAKRGNTGVRGGLKLAVLTGDRGGLSLIVSSNVNRTQENPYTGATTAPVYDAELAADTHSGRLALGVNAGYRWREPGAKIDDALIEPLGSEALASLALGCQVGAHGTLITEAYGSKALAKGANETDRALDSAEALLGYKHTLTASLDAHVGFGTELLHGLATPDWRFYAGLVTTFGGGGDQDRLTAQKTAKARRPQPVAQKRARPEPRQEPPGAAIPTQEPDETVVLDDINFEFDSDFRVMPGAFAELDRVAKRLQHEPFTTIVVEGHTDWMGSDEYNDDLSFRRASTVRRYLVKTYGLNAAALIAIGYGERRPVRSNSTDAGRLKNRRVEVKIFKD